MAAVHLTWVKFDIKPIGAASALCYCLMVPAEDQQSQEIKKKTKKRSMMDKQMKERREKGKWPSEKRFFHKLVHIFFSFGHYLPISRISHDHLKDVTANPPLCKLHVIYRLQQFLTGTVSSDVSCSVPWTVFPLLCEQEEKHGLLSFISFLAFPREIGNLHSVVTHPLTFTAAIFFHLISRICYSFYNQHHWHA